MSDSSIDRAYCVELGYDVDILEANDYYFSLPHLSAGGYTLSARTKHVGKPFIRKSLG